MEATAGEGVDVILDLLGGSYFPDSLASLAAKGRMIVVGLTAGRSAEVDLGTLLRKRLHVTGTTLRARPLEEKIAAARAFDHDVGPLLASGQVRAIIDRTFRLEEVAEAHRYMEANKNFGKILLELSS